MHYSIYCMWRKWHTNVSINQVLINDTADPTHYNILLKKNNTKLTLKNLTEDDSGKYTCSAVFDIKPTESQLDLKVLSFIEPLKPFLVIAAEVVVLVTLILLYERQSQKRNGPAGTTGKIKKHSEFTSKRTTCMGKHFVCFKLNTSVLSQLHREWTVWTYTVSTSILAF